jgi:uncharacterized protein YkwD
MFSSLLTPLLMLLSVFGLYSPPRPLQHTPPSEIVRPAPINVADAATTTPVYMPAPVVVEKKIVAKEEMRPEPTVPAASTPVAPKPAAVPTADFATDTEARILTLMNAERDTEGLAALTNDARLTKLAKSHSADMLVRDYFDHDDPEGCSSSCRANAASYEWSAIGENIYMTDGYGLSSEKEAAMVVEGWMRSNGHRANILGTKFTHAGVGVAVEGKKVVITAVYAKPR